MISCLCGHLKSQFTRKCILTLLFPCSFKKRIVHKVVISKKSISLFKKKTKQTKKLSLEGGCLRIALILLKRASFSSNCTHVLLFQNTL